MARTSLPTMERYFNEPHPFLTSLAESLPEKPKLSFIEYINKYGSYKPWATEEQYKLICKSVTSNLIYQHLARSSHICIDNTFNLSILDQRYVTYTNDSAKYQPKCHLTERFVFIPINLVFYTTSLHEPLPVYVGSHAMMVLIDNYYQEIELFEPNGIGAPWYPSLALFLQIELRKYYPTYNFISDVDISQYRGIQIISDRPICASFSLLLFWAHLYDPRLNRREIIQQLNMMRQRDLNIFMDRFISFIAEYAQNVHITEIVDTFIYNGDLLIEILDKVPFIDTGLWNRLFQLNTEYKDNFNLRGLKDLTKEILCMINNAPNTPY